MPEDDRELQPLLSSIARYVNRERARRLVVERVHPSVVDLLSRRLGGNRPPPPSPTAPEAD